MLADARAAGDRRREATALTDLAIMSMSERAPDNAVGLLEEALRLAGALDDRALEADVRLQLALAALMLHDPRQAHDLLHEVLSYARERGDRFTEKTAFDYLGLTFAKARDPLSARASYEQALAIACKTGDREHEANLLWHIAIQHAELGQRDQAVSRAQQAVFLFHALGKPESRAFSEHLERYRADETRGTLEACPTGSPAAARTGSNGKTESSLGFVSYALNYPTHQPAGPGLLRMALSAAKAMARFVGSGLQTVPAEVRKERLRICATCSHHTGLRCKLCGCFTGLKSQLPHESCPISKWQG